MSGQVSPEIEAAAKAIWESQDAAVNAARPDRLNWYAWRSDRLPDSVWDGFVSSACAAIEPAVAAERERCAQVADSMNSTQNIGDRIRHGLGGES